MYTVEFQKRGLPHAHILVWLSSENKLKTGTDIDKIISTVLPDSTLYPRLYDVDSSYMMHGSCGGAHPFSPCMDRGRCMKYYPKDFKGTTTIDDEGYPRGSNWIIDMSSHTIHIFSLDTEGHVNVECCNKSNSIKYLLKYVNKGPDKALMQLSVDGEKRDKSKPAVWRIFAFDIHHKWPPVLKLTFHLHNEQSVLFDDYHDIEDVVMYNEFTYENKDKRWQPRKAGYQIGRLPYTPLGIGELYYMRILLTVQKGCMGYRCIKTINGHTYDTFQEACSTLGLLDDDKEFIDGITENAELGSGHQLRWLFVHLLTTSTMKSPDVVWDATCQLLSDVFLFERRKHLNIP
ncbi:AT hook motif protein, putative, partial [Medicago truncatula]